MFSKKPNNFYHLGLFFVLLFLAAGLRFYRLGQNPTFIADEASIGYNAYSILKTGRDEWGTAWPLSFKAFGEYKLPLYIYLTVPLVAVFGLNEFAVRFVSAFSGTVAVGLVFLLAAVLRRSSKNCFWFSFLPAFSLAVNPWHLQASRLSLEASLGLALFLAGLALFLKKRFWATAIFAALAFYTYNGLRVFIPLFVFTWFVLARPKLNFSKLKPFLLFLLLVLPLIFSGFQGSSERIFKTGFFNDPGLVAGIESWRVGCQAHLPALFCRLVYNRPVVFSSVFAKNYFSHFLPDFLFRENTSLAQYGVPSWGSLFWPELFLLPAGIIFCLTRPHLKTLFLAWILAAPVATSVTGPAHPVRSLILAPALAFLSGWGLLFWRSFFFPKVSAGRHRQAGKTVFSLILILAELWSLFLFWQNYFQVYPLQTGSIWQQAYKPLFTRLAEKEKESASLWVSKFYGEPHIFYLFYRRIDPSAYQKTLPVVKYDRADRWVNVDQIGDYHFFDPRDYLPGPGLQVWAAQEKNLPAGGETVNFQNGSTAFVLFEAQK